MRFPFRRAAARPPADPEAAAAYWAARRRLGLNSAADEGAFGVWLGDPDNAAAFAAVERALDAAGDLAADPEVAIMRRRALDETRPKERTALLWLGLGVIIVLFAAWIWARARSR